MVELVNKSFERSLLRARVYAPGLSLASCTVFIYFYSLHHHSHIIFYSVILHKFIQGGTERKWLLLFALNTVIVCLSFSRVGPTACRPENEPHAWSPVPCVVLFKSLKHTTCNSINIGYALFFKDLVIFDSLHMILYNFPFYLLSSYTYPAIHIRLTQPRTKKKRLAAQIMTLKRLL